MKKLEGILYFSKLDGNLCVGKPSLILGGASGAKSRDTPLFMALNSDSSRVGYWTSIYLMYARLFVMIVRVKVMGLPDDTILAILRPRLASEDVTSIDSRIGLEEDPYAKVNYGVLRETRCSIFMVILHNVLTGQLAMFDTTSVLLSNIWRMTLRETDVVPV